MNSKFIFLCLFSFLSDFGPRIAADHAAHSTTNEQFQEPHADNEATSHSHTLRIKHGATLERVDSLILSKSRASGKRKVLLTLDDTSGEQFRGIVGNSIVQPAEQNVVCLERLVEDPKVCLKFEIEITGNNIKKDTIVISTKLDFKSFMKHADKTYRTIDSPEYFIFNAPTLIYNSHEIDDTLPHQFKISTFNMAKQNFGSKFKKENAETVVQQFDSNSIPRIISFPYQTRDALVELREVVKKVSINSFNGNAHFVYSGVLQSLRNFVTVPFTSYEMDKYLAEKKKHNSDYNDYLTNFLLSPQYPIESFYVSDKAGKNYFTNQHMNNIVLFFRYGLLSDWKTNFNIKYSVNLKSMISSNAEDGSKILRLINGESDDQDLKPGDVVKTIVNLPEGASLKSINAPFASKIETEKINGIAKQYVRITLYHDRSLNSKITVNYFDSSSFFSNLIIIAVYYVLPAIIISLLLYYIDFSIENSQETENLNIQKKNHAKLCKNTKTYLKMLSHSQSILENYKIKKDINLLAQSFNIFKENCSQYLNKELLPYIELCNKPDIVFFLSQISEANQQHIEALDDFHNNKMDRQSYINNRRVINDVIEQAEKQIVAQLKTSD